VILDQLITGIEYLMVSCKLYATCGRLKDEAALEIIAVEVRILSTSRKRKPPQRTQSQRVRLLI
jgi:hypothetical protein